MNKKSGNSDKAEFPLFYAAKNYSIRTGSVEPPTISLLEWGVAE